MSYLADSTPELSPITGVIVSQNAKVMMGGLELMKVSDVTVRYGNQVGVYAEIGDRRQTPYVGAIRVGGTINRAYINSAEWRLLLGLPSSVHEVGKIFKSGDLVYHAENTTNFGNTIEVGARSYPIRVDIELETNRDGVPESVIGTPSTTTGKKRTIIVKNCILDAGGISFNENGLITSGAITFEGESLLLKIE